MKKYSHKKNGKKIEYRYPILLMALIALVWLGLPIGSAELQAQETAGVKDQGTIVTSTRFRLDLTKKEGVFSGEVKVSDPGFELSSEELIAFFDDNNQVERLVARGKVSIVQGGKRSATSREAEYLVSDKSLKLTGDPVVSQEGNEITGVVIRMFPDGDRMEVDGRSKVEFFLND
jgi:lipopolysaccharide transport protein LptA